MHKLVICHYVGTKQPNLKKCIRDWLIEAGTKEGITRTLIVKDEAAYNALVDYLPDDWKKGAAGTTVQYGIKNE